MPAGKLSAQTGHAFTDTLHVAEKINPSNVLNYRTLGKGGSKISLYSKNENQLIVAYNKAIELGIPCSIVVDQNHILLPHFDGSPVITALGIGPCTQNEAKIITKKFQCIK